MTSTSSPFRRHASMNGTSGPKWPAPWVDAKRTRTPDVYRTSPGGCARSCLPPHAGDQTSPNADREDERLRADAERPDDLRGRGIDARDRAVAEIRDPDEAVGRDRAVDRLGADAHRRRDCAGRWVDARHGSVRGRSRPRARSRRRPRTRPGSYGRSAHASPRSWRGRSGRRCRRRSSRPRPCPRQRSGRPARPEPGWSRVTRFVAGFTRETVLSELFVTQTESAAKRTSYEP